MKLDNYHPLTLSEVDAMPEAEKNARAAEILYRGIVPGEDYKHEPREQRLVRQAKEQKPMTEAELQNLWDTHASRYE